MKKQPHLFLISCFILLAFQINALSAQPVVQRQAPALNGITQAAARVGVLTCSNSINQVTNFLALNTVAGALLFTPRQQPDKEIFSSSLEIIPDKKRLMYASTSFFPNSINGCSAVYDTVEYVKNSCSDVQKEFKGVPRTGVLKKNITVLDAGGMKVFLMPAGHGCIVIKKQVVQ